MTNPSSSAISQAGLSALDRLIKTDGLPVQRGIEKEGLRTRRDFHIAQSDHPKALGHPLTHGRITTDYSEALLELITSVHESRDDLLSELEQIHAFIQSNIGDEFLWAGSMPCHLDGEQSIRIAEYGNSNIGQLKHVYRQGLGVRYGRIMQSIAGLHFNFSLKDRFWESLQTEYGDTQSLKDFKSGQYFSLIRNFRRHAWLLMYLFGASPALDKSFVSHQAKTELEQLGDSDTLYKPYACSLRMGDLGYHNNAQSSLNICFNTLENFTHTLGQAIKTPYAPYQEIGIQKDGKFVQLNCNILQIENEYYSSVRPKRTTFSGEKPTQALIERGVEYIEVRCMDLDPMLPLGIDAASVDFLDIMLLHSLLKESPYIDDRHCQELEQNFALTVDQGRNPDLKLRRDGQEIALSDWGMELIDEMRVLAETLDQANGDARYQRSIDLQMAKLKDPDLTPSARVLNAIKSEQSNWLEFAAQQSLAHQNSLQALYTAQSEALAPDFETEATESFVAARAREDADDSDFATFLRRYQES